MRGTGLVSRFSRLALRLVETGAEAGRGLRLQELHARGDHASPGVGIDHALDAGTQQRTAAVDAGP